MIFFQTWTSAIGEIFLVSSHDALLMCDWLHGAKFRRHIDKLRTAYSEKWIEEDCDILRRSRHEITEFLNGNRTEFSVSYALTGTDFQKAVWRAVSKIPYGSTVSYVDIAIAIGKPSSVRAVANAIGANPLPLIIPCHRVVGSDGAITGYSGGRLVKRTLLQLENGNKTPLCFMENVHGCDDSRG